MPTGDCGRCRTVVAQIIRGEDFKLGADGHDVAFSASREVEALVGRQNRTYGGIDSTGKASLKRRSPLWRAKHFKTPGVCSL